VFTKRVDLRLDTRVINYSVGGERLASTQQCAQAYCLTQDLMRHLTQAFLESEFDFASFQAREFSAG